MRECINKGLHKFSRFPLIATKGMVFINELVISKQQAREFATACFEQIIKEIAEAEKHEKELTNNESENEHRMGKAA